MFLWNLRIVIWWCCCETFIISVHAIHTRLFSFSCGWQLHWYGHVERASKRWSVNFLLHLGANVRVEIDNLRDWLAKKLLGLWEQNEIRSLYHVTLYRFKFFVWHAYWRNLIIRLFLFLEISCKHDKETRVELMYCLVRHGIQVYFHLVITIVINIIIFLRQWSKMQWIKPIFLFRQIIFFLNGFFSRIYGFVRIFSKFQFLKKQKINKKNIKLVDKLHQ